MNLQEILQLTSTLLADSSNNFYTLTERLQAINVACNYINSELRILRNTVEITVTPTNEGKLPIPQNFVSLTSGIAWKELSGQITYLNAVSPMQLQMGTNTTWSSDTGTPDKYVIEGSNIYLIPIPATTGSAILSYLALPNKLLNDTDVPFYGDVRVQAYHEMIAYYAAWQLSMKDRDFEASQQFMSYFQSRMIDLKENLRHTGSLVQPVWSDTYSTI